MGVLIYTAKYCGYCVRAKALLEVKGVFFKEIPVDGDAALRREMMQLSGSRTVPQIWIGGKHIGGCSELMALDTAGQLDQLLAVSDKR